MEVKYKQSSIGWCTVYTWANLLNDSEILRFLNDDCFKGCGEAEENEIISQFLPGCKIFTVAYSNQQYPPLNKDFIYSIVESNEADLDCAFENAVIIYTLSVRRIKSVWHSVGMIKSKTGLFYVDPYRPEWIKINYSWDLYPLFIDCCQISRPYIAESDRWAVVDGNSIKHEFLTI